MRRSRWEGAGEQWWVGGGQDALEARSLRRLLCTFCESGALTMPPPPPPQCGHHNATTTLLVAATAADAYAWRALEWTPVRKSLHLWQDSKEEGNLMEIPCFL